MNVRNDDPLREISWRRKLTDAEQAELAQWLKHHPEASADWEVEAALNRALDALPLAEVPSNFTARVLKAVDNRQVVSNFKPRRAWWVRFIPKAALATIIAATGCFSFQYLYAARERAEVVQGLLTVSNLPALPNSQVLEDFEAIRLSAVVTPDEKLLTLFNEASK